jgi:2-(1,2-epoxy-1,2-dihydrophenyl)acetyl-CoA isomerase
MSVVEVAIDGPVARVVLNRPDEGNAIDLEVARHLRDAVEAWDAAGCRVAVVSAKGSVFCGGGDVRAMSTEPDGYVRELADALHDAFRAMAASPAVVIAAVHGAAAGAGFGLVLNADLVVAADTAVFLSAYAALGVTPDGGTSYLLPRIVGPKRAMDLVLGGRRLSAGEAEQWGIVNRTVSAPLLTETVDALTGMLAGLAPGAIAGSKKLLSQAWIDGFHGHLDAESESIARLVRSEESLRLQEAFLSPQL